VSSCVFIFNSYIVFSKYSEDRSIVYKFSELKRILSIITGTEQFRSFFWSGTTKINYFIPYYFLSLTWCLRDIRNSLSNFSGIRTHAYFLGTLIFVGERPSKCVHSSYLNCIRRCFKKTASNRLADGQIHRNL
jgi:hypothetical protein